MTRMVRFFLDAHRDRAQREHAQSDRAQLMRTHVAIRAFSRMEIAA
ncbi:MAG: hypothetical protein JO147_11550 [Actinobacteria bacterium]|nr:hypothetical protein [Actinomycetota bacterium]